MVLDYADERSVVQTRFATTALTLLRAHLGGHGDRGVTDARTALAEPLLRGLDPDRPRHLTRSVILTP